MSKTVSVFCPACNQLAPTHTGSYGLQVVECGKCGYAGRINLESPPCSVQPVKRQRARRSIGAQLKLPGVEPGRQQTALYQKEEEVQSQAVKALELLGFMVFQTTVRYKFQRCPDCGKMHRPEGGYGATPGITDLLVRHPSWETSEFLGIEVKGSKTAVSDVQKSLHERGQIYIHRTVSDILHTVNVYHYSRFLID